MILKEVTLLLFFFMHEGLECSNMSVASAAWLVTQPIIFVSYDQNKGSITNPVTQRGASRNVKTK